MSAFFNEPELKAAVMRQLRRHRRLDQIVQKIYFEDGRGCHLGCLTHCDENSHEAAERMFNLPLQIGYLLETVFEGLPEEDCGDWVIESTEAIPCGADLSLVRHHLAYWLLGPESPNAEGNAHASVAEVVSNVRELHRRVIAGEVLYDEEWSAAELAARTAWLVAAVKSAEESAAESAFLGASRVAASGTASAAMATAAMATASESVAESVYSGASRVAASGTASAAMATAWSGASRVAWKQIAAKLIDIFKACPVIACERCEDQVRETTLFLKSNELVKEYS